VFFHVLLLLIILGAKLSLNHLSKFWGPPQTMREFTLMQGGLVEWIKYNETFAGLGKPRTDFFQHAFNPLNDPPIKPMIERIYYFGFRLIWRSNHVD